MLFLFRYFAFFFSLFLFAQCNSETTTTANFNTYCSACHTTGAAGAPLIGCDSWQTRSKNGIDALVAITKKGTMSMPAYGRCTTCSDQEFRDIIEFMMKK